MAVPKRIKDFYSLVMDFVKKCNDDHVAAFGSMSAFFILLSLFPFLILINPVALHILDPHLRVCEQVIVGTGLRALGTAE